MRETLAFVAWLGGEQVATYWIVALALHLLYGQTTWVPGPVSLLVLALAPMVWGAHNVPVRPALAGMIVRPIAFAAMILGVVVFAAARPSGRDAKDLSVMAIGLIVFAVLFVHRTRQERRERSKKDAG